MEIALSPVAFVRSSRTIPEDDFWGGTESVVELVRPNRIGTSLVRILGHEGTRLRVAELDAIDGTPVLDIKPVWRGMLPREPVTEPDWATELMREYFSRR